MKAKPNLTEDAEAVQSFAKRRDFALGAVDQQTVLQSKTDLKQFSQVISFQAEGSLFPYLNDVQSLQTNANGANLGGDRTTPFPVDRYRRSD